MFTGIVETTGVIVGKSFEREGCRWEIACPFARELHLGNSVAVDGTCHTVTDKNNESFTTFSSPETLAITAMKDKRRGDIVNLERSLRVGERLEGHWIYGHVDRCTEVSEIRTGKNSSVYAFRMATPWQKYLIAKGSVCLNGVSLTVYEKGAESFSVMLIPYTLRHTNLGRLETGDLVNVELDPMGKYLENFLSP